jgi:hypothetical protein
LRHTDLEALFSNRHLRFAGDWDDAFVALAHEIDPRGTYKLWDRPAPPVVRQVPLVEGGFSGSLLRPPVPPSRGAMGWAATTGPAAIMSALVETLARINKYGEPATGLRTATLAAARFMANDLARIPGEVTKQDENAQRLGSVGSQARGVLRGRLGAVHPSILAQRAAAPAPPAPANRAGELPLDGFDLANAVLDIFSSVDEAGRRSGRFVPRQDAFEDEAPWVTSLVEIASARTLFGGSAPPGSPHDAVACRAFSALVDLADARTRGAATLRDELLDIYAREAPRVGSPAGTRARFAVVRAALIMTGVESAEEGKRLVKTIIDVGIGGTGVGGDAEAAATVTTLRALMRSAGGTDRDTHRTEIADAANALFQEFQKQVDGGSGSPEENRLLKAWRAAGGDVQLPGLGGPCRPTPGRTKGRIFLYAICVDGLQVIQHPYVGVPMIVEAQFDPPSGEAEVTLDVTLGEATKMTVKRFEPKGYIYRSEPFVPQEASLKKEDVFNPAPPPK